MVKQTLGKGLGELLKNSSISANRHDDSQDTNLDIQQLPIEQIRPNPRQPRKTFDDASLSELAASIKQNGFIQPLVVRSNPAGGFELVAGERRWRAAGLAQLDHVPVVVRALTDKEVVLVGLVENLQREDLNAVEESEAYVQLQEEFHLTHGEIGELLGKARSTITNLIRLRELSPRVLESLRCGEIELGHAKLLVGRPQPEQVQVCRSVVQRRLSVRQTEQLLKRIKGGKKSESQVDPNVLKLQEELSDTLGAPTTIRLSGKSKQKGELVVKFHSLDELNGIIDHVRRGSQQK